MCVSGRPMNPGAGRKDSYLDLENSKFRCQCLSRGFLHGEGEGSVHHIVLIDVCEAFSALEREPLYNGGVCVKITFVSSKQEKNVIDRRNLETVQDHTITYGAPVLSCHGDGASFPTNPS